MNRLIIEGMTVEALGKGKNFQVRICPLQAARLLKNNSDKIFDMMCKKYGQNSEWVAVSERDLNDDVFFDPEYQTFEIWLNSPLC